MNKATEALRRIIGLWDSLDAVGPEEPAEPYKEQMDAAVNDARKVLEGAYLEAATDPDYRRDSAELNPASVAMTDIQLGELLDEYAEKWLSHDYTAASVNEIAAARNAVTEYVERLGEDRSDAKWKALSAAGKTITRLRSDVERLQAERDALLKPKCGCGHPANESHLCAWWPPQ